MLHHSTYRVHFAENLRQGIPRVPFAEKFDSVASIGDKLIKLHIGYESAPRFNLKWVEHPEEPFFARVTGRMRLDKELGNIAINEVLTVEGIPKEAFEYVLGTRSALEWVVDQYRVEKDEDDNIKSDPNDPNDDEYIVHLIERVTTVSLQTVALVAQLLEAAPDLAKVSLS
jgi:predicted helicase